MEDWTRKHFIPGGGDPFLFYAAFGEIDTAAPLSASRYRCADVPEEIELMSYRKDDQRDFNNVHVEIGWLSAASRRIVEP
jgi:hypothetical protein